MGGLVTPRGYPKGYIGYRDKWIYVKENKLVEGKDIKITTHYILVHSYCHRSKLEQAEVGVTEPVLLATVETTPPAPLIDEMQHQNETTPPILSSAEGSMPHEMVTSADVNTVTTPTITPRQPVAGKDLAKLADSGAGILSDVSES
ncbi:uncharacterized protein LOC122849275 [Aphidius gifuensis]|uniref:uncharacterized protein LOC122849275 n=1 Tax=Aphidius gifuensis TaxID=684658 RepID=UPI001CDC3421|nr:uncharacterized protein LOC122849275 [Aphidius gifuensis]